MGNSIPRRLNDPVKRRREYIARLIETAIVLICGSVEVCILAAAILLTLAAPGVGAARFAVGAVLAIVAVFAFKTLYTFAIDRGREEYVPPVREQIAALLVEAVLVRSALPPNDDGGESLRPADQQSHELVRPTEKQNHG